MSIVARFTIPADQFPLGDVLEVRRGIRIRLESMVPTGDWVIPFFWVPSDDADAVAAALEGSPLIDDYSVVDEVGSETLFRVEWSPDVNGVIDAIEDADAVLLEADGMGDAWSFRMRFPERDAVSEFYRSCVEEGMDIDLDEINNPLESGAGSEFGLTDTQHEALLTALEAGYFAVPRQVTLEELADSLDISDTATSQRIRRGLTTLLSTTLVREHGGDRDD